MKHCARCDKNLPYDQFYKRKGTKTGLDWYCKQCSNLITRKRYQENPEAKRKRVSDYAKNNRSKINAYRKEQRELHPKRNSAWQKVYRAIKSGKLVKPDRCSECLEAKEIEAHHFNYDMPLAVIWLCDVCHNHLHKLKYGDKSCQKN